MNKGRILSIEDDANLQFVIKHFLEDQGYEVLTANNGRDLIEKVRNIQIDVILLDLILPDSDGLNLMREIRLHSTAPIIVVSGKDEPTDKILGLEMGADDYIGKPFEMRELYARIKAVMRRAVNETSLSQPALTRKDATRLKFNEWILDRGAFNVINAQGQSAELTTTEFRILDTLLNSAGRVLSREQLFDMGRGHDYQPYDRAIDIHIARLRKKLGDNVKSTELIKTIRGAGYMLSADIEILE